MQLTFADLVSEMRLEGDKASGPGRGVLRLRELDARVAPIYWAGQRSGRLRVLEFLGRWHYLHGPGARTPTFTWAFGLFLRGELAGVVTCNPPAAGVWDRYYGITNPWSRGMIAITRTCCADSAPKNSESFLVGSALRLLPRLDDRWHTVIAQSDLSVTGGDGKRHVGVIYMASNGYFAGYSRSGTWRGFRNPDTGARLSRKCAGRTRSLAECPPGWVVEESPVLANFLWFVGPAGDWARQHVKPSIQLLVQQQRGQERYPVWRRPHQISKATPRAYLAAHKMLREIAL